MKSFKLLPFCAVVFTLTLLCGCYDSREIDETAYIIALGVDKGEDGVYAYTFQLANPLEMTSGEEKTEGKSTDSSVRNFVVASPDFYIAKNQLNNYLSKNVDMSHLKLIVFSKALENSEFLQHSQFLMHERQVRPHTNVAISHSSAEEFIRSVKPTLEANTAKYYELMGLRSDNVFAPSVTISAFLDKISDNSKASALPMAYAAASTTDAGVKAADFWIDASSTRIDDSSGVLKGMAIFKGGMLCGTMNEDSAMIFNILTGKIKTCTITLKNPADNASNLIFKLNVPSCAKYRLSSEKSKYKVCVSQRLDLEFIGSFLPKGFKSRTELFNFARQAISQKTAEFVYDLSRTKKADILNIGNYLKAQSDSMYQWQNIFETAEYDINIF